MNAPETVYLSLGSNVGDRAGQIARAVDAMAKTGIRPVRQSSFYLTEPVGGVVQPPFLNCVVETETEWSPQELLQRVLQVELALGRKRLVPKGPRTIDIDILFYGASVIHTPDLTIPHPCIAERRFVLVPLQEIAGDFRHPLLHRTVSELLASTEDRSAVELWREFRREAG